MNKLTALLSFVIISQTIYYIDEKTGIVLEEYHFENKFEDSVDLVTTTGAEFDDEITFEEIKD